MQTWPKIKTLVSIFFNVITNSLLAKQAVIFFITACSLKAYPQQVQSDEEYYSILDEYSHLGIGFTNRHNSFTVLFKDYKEANTRYVSNSKRVLGIGFHLFNVGLAFSMPLSTKEGAFNNIDFRSNILERRWGLDIAFQKYLGYESEVVRDDVFFSNTMINGYYIFNFRKYSLPATSKFLEIQNKNAGSFLGHVVFSRTRVQADSSLFSSMPLVPNDTLRRLRGFRFVYAGLLPGYGYTFSKNLFFANLALSVGPVHVWKKYDFERFDEKDFSFDWATLWRTTVGYSSKRLFYGISAYLSHLKVDYKEVGVNASSWQVKLFVGLRFQEKGVFRKSISDVYQAKKL